MAIKITEDGAVKYVNENDVDRTLFPNLFGAMGDEQYDALNGRLTVVEGKVSDLEECCDDVNTDIGQIKNDLYNAYVTETETGSIASFTDGADGVPVKDLTVAIEPVQSGSGDPSPDNVRPISGWTGANVTVNDEVLSVNWQTEAGTVYGGTLDVTTGVLTVDRVLWTKNTSTMNNDANYPGWMNAGIAELIGSGLDVKKTNQLMNIGTVYGVNTIIHPTTGNQTDTLYLPVSIYNKTQNEWKALAMDIQIAVELATPQTYQLTPEEVKTILGQNNIFADTGNVTVQYRADTKLYIDKVLNA